jgi:hypothetical protein
MLLYRQAKALAKHLAQKHLILVGNVGGAWLWTRCTAAWS